MEKSYTKKDYRRKIPKVGRSYKRHISEDKTFNKSNINDLVEEIYFEKGIIDPEKIKIGTEVEMEHTKDKKEARKIAMDHLKENSKYYNTGAKEAQKDLKVDINEAKAKIEKGRGKDLKPRKRKDTSMSAESRNRAKDKHGRSYIERRIDELEEEPVRVGHGDRIVKPKEQKDVAGAKKKVKNKKIQVSEFKPNKHTAAKEHLKLKEKYKFKKSQEENIMTTKIEQEINNMADNMEKSTQDPRIELIKTIKELGPENLKKSMDDMSDGQKDLLKSILEDMKKSLFPKENAPCCDKVEESRPETKDDVANELKYKIEDLKKLKDLKYTIEDEIPEAKDIFEKRYSKLKSEIKKLVEKYPNLKKSVSMDDVYAGDKHFATLENMGTEVENGSDDEDEKLVKLEAAKHNHQGNRDPEGIDEIVIKADEVKASCGDEVAEKLEKEKKDKKPKVQGENYNMKKSKEELVALKDEIVKSYDDAGLAYTDELIKGEMKKRLLSEESQVEMGGQDKGGKPDKADKKAPKDIKVGEDADETADEALAKVGKVKKSIIYDSTDKLLKANTLGRNHHFSVNDYYTEIVKKSKEEPKKEEKLEKSDKKLSINEIIEKGIDETADEILVKSMFGDQKMGDFCKKSFSDEDMNDALGIEEEPKKEEK